MITSGPDLVRELAVPGSITWPDNLGRFRRDVQEPAVPAVGVKEVILSLEVSPRPPRLPVKSLHVAGGSAVVGEPPIGPASHG